MPMEKKRGKLYIVAEKGIFDYNEKRLKIYHIHTEENNITISSTNKFIETWNLKFINQN